MNYAEKLIQRFDQMAERHRQAGGSPFMAAHALHGEGMAMVEAVRIVLENEPEEQERVIRPLLCKVEHATREIDPNWRPR